MLKRKNCARLNSEDLLIDHNDIEMKESGNPTDSMMYASDFGQVWARARVKLRGIVLLNLECKRIRTFGATPILDESNQSNPKSLVRLLANLESRRLYEVEEAVMPGFVFHPSCTFKKWWNLVLVLLLVYTATVMPFRIAFEDDRYRGNWLPVELIVDILFWLDIFINFFSAYENNAGTIISNRRKICKNYLTGWFVLDVVSSFPFDLINMSDDSEASTSGYHNLLRLLRLPRLYRLFRITRILKLVKETKDSEFVEKLQDLLSLNTAVVRTASFAVTVLVVVHIVGCFWFLLAKLENFEPDCWVVRNGLLDEPKSAQYIASIYWAFTTLSTVGYGDIVPKTPSERVFGIIWMMLGVGFYSFTIGSLTSILSNMDSTKNELTIKLTAIDQISKESKLSKSLTRQLRSAVKLHAKKTELDTDYKQVMFAALPKRLRYQVAKQMYGSAANTLPYFSKRSPEFVSMIIPCLKFNYVEADDYVYREFNDSDEIYILFKGCVKFVLNVKSVPFKMMFEGCYFGDIEVYSKEKRLNSVKAMTGLELLTMSREVNCKTGHQKYR
jgi:hypothetical protein